MNNELLPLYSALIGAVIGSAASVLTVWIQSRIQAKRDLLVAASQIAIEDYKAALEHARTLSGKVTVMPAAAYMIHHAELLNLLISGKISTTQLEQLMKKMKSINETIERQQ